MKYLILLLLILSSCTDKENTNQESATQDMLKSKATQTNTDSLIASYDKGLDLILLESNFKLWYGEYSSQYNAIYWLSNQNQYYYADIYETNNITYTLDTNKQFEKTFLEQKEYFDRNNITSILYMGSIAPLERVYLNPSNKQLFLKKLTLIDDSTYYYYYEERNETTNKPLLYPVYPTRDQDYTNTLGETFYRIREFDTKMRGKLIQYIIAE